MKINGVPANEILSNLLKYSPGELYEYKIRVIESLFPMVYKFTYDDRDEFIVEMKNSDLITTHTINAVDNKEQSIPEFVKPSRFYFVNNVAVIDLRNFQSSDFKSFIDSSFAQIADKECESLIIDLRHNVGGQSMLADSLISYLTNEYSLFLFCYCKTNVKQFSYTFYSVKIIINATYTIF